MTTGDFEVLPITGPKYDQAVTDYWKWILGYPNPDPDIEPVVNGIFHTRPLSNYTNLIKDHNVAQRANLPVSSNNRVNRKGAMQDPLLSPRLIFVVFIDTFINNTYINPDTGKPFTATEMNNALKIINDTVTAEDMKATIERIGSGDGPQPIVKNMLAQRLQVPTGSPTSVFRVDIDKNSTLADKLEFIQPKGQTVEGRAEGFYALINIKTPGTYHIENSAHGLRNYRTFYSYDIEVR